MGITLTGHYWSDAATDTLKRLDEAGLLSRAQMAMRINEEFGTSYTRNAVIGRARRVGLVAKRAPRDHKPRVRIIRANWNSNRRRIIQSAEPAETIKLRCVEVVPRNLTIFELELGDCRYPYGQGSEITFCGHAPVHQRIIGFESSGEPIKRASSYCTAHHFLCVGHGTYSEQRANVVAKELVA